MADSFAQFKQMQKQSWAHFAPLEAVTTPAAAYLVQFARVEKGQRLLDVGCGTGVVAVTAARRGAVVRAIDLTPQLLERARENGKIAGVDVDWHEGDAEQLPFGDAEFDVVLSQFAHIFAPRPEVVTAEMLRVLKPGGTIAFSTWPPEHLVGRTTELVGRFMPPPPPGVQPPMLWGVPEIIRQRLGTAVKDITFDRHSLFSPALSEQHYRGNVERTAGPILRLVELLSGTNPDALATFRKQFDAIVADYLSDNIVRQGFLLTRAVKN
jgi:SAM-dependent methyltransferase